MNNPDCSNPDLPAGVTQRDIDRLAEPLTQEDELHDKIESLEKRIQNIKHSLEDCTHPAGCGGWKMGKKFRSEFEIWHCDCAIGDSLHQIEMSDGSV
jgi:hypothetical protein